MTALALLDAFPDLVLELRRDGTIVSRAGGSEMRDLRLPPDAVGQPLAAVYSSSVAASLKQCVRRAIASRGSYEAIFVHLSTRYEVRVSARSKDLALCVIRALNSPVPERGEGRDKEQRFDRREFWHRVSDSIATASLRGRALALAIIDVEGLADVRKFMDSNVAEQVIASALRTAGAAGEQPEPVPWFVGQFADGELGVVVSSADRDTIETLVSRVCTQLSHPVLFGDASFEMRPRAGVAILGQDAVNEPTLIEHARAAMVEAQRLAVGGVSFFSDTMKLRSLTRIDVALELREAIARGEIGLRYRSRHDLASKKLVTLVGYLEWDHPIRGRLAPGQFLPVAAATGLSTALSRSILENLRRDAQRYESVLRSGARISYGALRHHVLEPEFFKDISAMLLSHALRAEYLELRISERSYVAKERCEWRHFTDQGVNIVVDEVGRKMSSIDRLARAPIAGLQLDRRCAVAMHTDEAASRVGRAVLGVAQALAVTPITTAVDSERQRQSLLALGWRQGSGDLFGPVKIV